MLSVSLNKTFPSFLVQINSQAADSIKISNLLVCFCSFDLSCRILEKDNFIKNVLLISLCFSFFICLGYTRVIFTILFD